MKISIKGSSIYIYHPSRNMRFFYKSTYFVRAFEGYYKCTSMVPLLSKLTGSFLETGYP